jgi:hypothetical protein
MKVRFGGGGVDMQGNWIQDPEFIKEVPDDFFERLRERLDESSLDKEKKCSD